MRLEYDPDADVLMVAVRDDPPVDALEEPGGVIVSYGADGQPVSVEFLQASVRGLIRAPALSMTLSTDAPITSALSSTAEDTISSGLSRMPE